MEVSYFGLCQMTCVFKPRINPKFKRPGNLKGVAGFKKQTGLTHGNVDGKLQRHQPLVLIVFPTQMIK